MQHQLLTLTLAPILLFQGKKVRRETPQLPEPDGARSGVSGEGKVLKLLVLGDSAAAGVGAKHQDQALLGQLVKYLSPHYELHWHLHAKTGETTQTTLDGLKALAGKTFDVAVVSLGVNDVTKQVGFTRWMMLQEQLRQVLSVQFGVKHILLSGLPPMHEFPALPQPLRWYLGRRANQFNQSLQEQISHTHNAHFINLRLSEDKSVMASDGFHPGPKVYALWAQQVAAKVLTLFS